MAATLTVEDLKELVALIRRAGGIEQIRHYLAALDQGEARAEPSTAPPPGERPAQQPQRLAG